MNATAVPAGASDSEGSPLRSASTTKLKGLLGSESLEFLMEAHNGLSAKIVEEVGFKGIWASGLSISAALGVRDNNEASWTQVLEVVEFMSDAVDIPILLDGDTGYGNFNNMRRLVRKLEQRGVAGVCIEDKLFPKTNSFISGERQPLADVEEFAGKIMAGKDAQSDPDFCIVARIEAFIAGWGLEEALRRAEAYHRAGADALLIHSKLSTPDQILEFARVWGRQCPIVIVPTMYYSTPAEVFERAGISVAIWANHNARSAITAMQRTSRQIFEERSVRSLEDQIVPVTEVFRLQGADELAAAEERYLPRGAPDLRAVILAASRGAELGLLTADRPKAMIPIGDRPLLHKLVDQLRQTGIRDVTVVRGYKKAEVHASGVRFVDNDEFENTGELASLDKAIACLEGSVVISLGDILFRRYVLMDLLAAKSDIAIVVDAAWSLRSGQKRYADYVVASQPYTFEAQSEEICLRLIDPEVDPSLVHGEWIGLMKTTGSGTDALRDSLARLRERGDFAELRFAHLFRDLVQAGHAVGIVYITEHWLDVDDLQDLERAQVFDRGILG